MATSTGFPTSMAALNTSSISYSSSLSSSLCSHYSQYRIICKPITFKRRFVIGRGRSGVPLNPRCGGMPEEDSDSRGSSMSALERLKISGADRYTKEKSSIIVLGLSIHTAPVEMREKLAIPEAEYPRAIRELCGFYHIEEAAVLSTCNRVEIYVVALSWHCGVRDVTEWMEKTSGVAASELRPHLLLLRGSDAINHLFEVSAGLDSLILGDEQILCRVKQVVNFGEGVTGFGRNLNGLFRYALRVGADVLTKTHIASGPIISVSSAAVELAIIKLPQNLSSTARVLVIGAGKMGKLVINHLVAKGWTKIVVVNRSEHRVDAIREDLSGVEIIYKPLTEMLTCASESDVVFTSTASNIPLFMKDNVETLPPVGTMNGGSRLFFDISVPRNVGSCVSDVENTQVYNVGDLKEVLAPKMEAMEAQAIVAKNLDDFRDKMDSFETVPTIKNLRALVETIRITELERCLSKIKHDIPKKTRRAIEDLSRGMMNKVLHGPMEHLRCDESNSRPLSEILENMHALNRMFSLETDASILEQKIRAKMEQSR